MELSEIVARTREITSLFDELVGEWDVSVMVTELTGEVGTLADSIMIQEGHRPARNKEDVIDLEDDIADILFMLIRIADHYDIDLEGAYQNLLRQTHRKLEQRLQAKNSNRQERGWSSSHSSPM
jgi:NTP pyrophosphatase (non-canonical NTP hydrolase)